METLTDPSAGIIIKSDCTGRTRYSTQFKQEVLDAFRSSAMSAPAFANHCGIKYPTFASWLGKRCREERGPAHDASPTFLVAHLPLPDHAGVTRGMRTTTNYNRFGTVIRKISQGIGYGTGDAIFDHMAVTAIDNVGRALTTAYFPTASSVTGDVAAATSPKWTTSQEFACCGVVTETDRTGIVTRHAYDSLRRRVKTNSLGVTNETAYKGRTTEIHRYAETVAATLSTTLAGTSANIVGRSVTNLAGTLQESWSPNPASATPGALVKSTTATSYKPAAGLSTRTVTTTPDNFSQTSDSFLDGKSATTSGDLSPAMTSSYAVTATGMVSSQSYVDGGILRETTSSQSDWAGRQLRTDFAGGAFATVSYNAIGQTVSSTDPDGTDMVLLCQEGHYKEIKQLQWGLRNKLLTAYKKCKNDDKDGPDKRPMPYSTLNEMANRPIKVPRFITPLEPRGIEDLPKPFNSNEVVITVLGGALIRVAAAGVRCASVTWAWATMEAATN